MSIPLKASVHSLLVFNPLRRGQAGRARHKFIKNEPFQLNLLVEMRVWSASRLVDYAGKKIRFNGCPSVAT